MSISGIFHMAGVRLGAVSSHGSRASEEWRESLVHNRIMFLRTIAAVLTAVVFGSLLTVSVMANSSPLSERLATLEEQVRMESKYRGTQDVLNAAAITALQVDVTNLKTTISMFNGIYAAMGGIVSILTIISILVTLKNPQRPKS